MKSDDSSGETGVAKPKGKGKGKKGKQQKKKENMRMNRLSIIRMMVMMTQMISKKRTMQILMLELLAAKRPLRKGLPPTLQRSQPPSSANMIRTELNS